MRSHFLPTILCAAALACASGVAADTWPRPEGRQAAGNAVTKWNGVALQVLPVDPGLLVDSRAFAIVHASIHDALNGIEPRYAAYTISLHSPGASVDAAVAAAARDAMIALAPSQATTVEIAYAAALLAVPEGAAKQAGIALGRQAAAANLARRVGDGADVAASPVYVPTGAPGDYAFTPPFDGTPFGPVALFPGWGNVTPFAVHLVEHRPPGPDPLTSTRYARDLEYLKSIGRFDSKTRTAEQTDIALFWFEFSPAGWNRIANTIVRQERVDPWRAARVLALVNFALADGYIAGFEAKYRFRFWRPVTAIRNAATDGNGATSPDAAWLPLHAPAFFTPPVPDYPSTHTVLGAAAATVLARSFGDQIRFSATSPTLPGAVRHYDRLSEAAVENGMSRVYGGIHFLNAVQDGYAQGRSIGQAVSQLLPALQ